MPLEQIPDISSQYYLINYDASGNERDEDGGSKMSQKVLEVLTQEAITDVFIFSHGWQGDIPAALNQYNRWVKAMAENKADREKMEQVRPGFKPLLIGLHWPSLPWGDEKIEASSKEETIEAMASHYAEQISESEAAKSALKTIFSEAIDDLEPDELSEATIAAYNVLNQEAGIGNEGAAAAPGDDRELFDPETIYEESKEIEGEILENAGEYGGLLDGGLSILSRVFSPLRALSYWKMKARARKFGEGAGFNLLTQLQQTASEQVRFHLVGHSFGCIVMSSTLGGPKAQGVLSRPVNSLTLIQGAVSLWAYCPDVPKSKNPGYFYPLIRNKKVAGPILTTLSEHDTAVGKLYPLASGVVIGDPSLDISDRDLPKYGAIGEFGIRGDDIPINNMYMLTCDQQYDFKLGQIYNLESSRYICNKPPEAGLAGAHGEFDVPEVAHAVWTAAMGEA